jgi:hypothetical protein
MKVLQGETVVHGSRSLPTLAKPYYHSSYLSLGKPRVREVSPQRPSNSTVMNSFSDFRLPANFFADISALRKENKEASEDT